MIDKSIKGIKYRLDEENQTAEVIKQENGYEGDIIIPETVVFQEVAYRVTSIGEGAFCQCEYLTSIVIPDSVTNIGQEAFEDCFSLEAIVIPNSVTSIGDCAFRDCCFLKSIRFNGTKAQWEKIQLGAGWNESLPTTVVRCTDGKVKI